MSFQPMSPAPPAPPARRRVRWGLGDGVLVLVGGFVTSTVVGVVSMLVRNPPPAGQAIELDATDIAVATAAQFAVMVALAVVLVRAKGRSGLADVGVGPVTLADGRWVVLGVLAAIAVNVIVLPLNNLWDRGDQAIGNELQQASGLVAAALAVLIVVGAPLAEELLFRGIVLRAALRRMPAAAAVLVSGFGFGSLHLLDLNTLPSVPGLALFGVVAAVVAVRTGRLAPAIGLHAGFNLLGVVALLVAR